MHVLAWLVVWTCAGAAFWAALCILPHARLAFFRVARGVIWLLSVCLLLACATVFMMVGIAMVHQTDPFVTVAGLAMFSVGVLCPVVLGVFVPEWWMKRQQVTV
jgi:hypothetical protein